jgi:sugar lactone lactonase YvrE
VWTALTLVTCQIPAPRPLLQEVRLEELRPRWPRPPANARVIYLGQISGEEEFDRSRSWLRRLADRFLGRSQERFVRPAALCVRGDRLAVADPGRRGVHVLDLSSRRWTTITQSAEGALASPVGVVFLPDGRLLVSDSAREEIFVYNAEGTQKGRFTDSALSRPTGMALDAERRWVWVAETLGHRVRAFDLSGREVAVVGERGSEPGQFNYPVRVAIDGEGGVWVSDSLNFRLQHIKGSGEVDRVFGMQGDQAGSFAAPRGLTVDERGRVLVVDTLFDAVQIFDPEGRLLLTFGRRGITPGEFWLPSDVTLDASNRIYVADSYNRRVQIFAYRPPDAE